MKEKQLPYAAKSLSFGIEGQFPQEGLFSFNNKGKKMHMPNSLRPKTKKFLTDVIEHESYMSISEPSRQLIFTYLFTPSSTKSIAKDAGTSSFSAVAQKLQRIMVNLWKNLPPEKQALYTKEEVMRLKDFRKVNKGTVARVSNIEIITKIHSERFIKDAQSVDVDYTKKTRRGPRQKKAAVFNLLYLEGPNFPTSIRDLYTKTPGLSTTWESTMIQGNPSIAYENGHLFYKANKDEKPQRLTPDLLEQIWEDTPSRRRDYLRSFALLTKEELRRFLLEKASMCTFIPRIKSGR